MHNAQQTAMPAYSNGRSSLAAHKSISILFEPWKCPRFRSVPSSDLVLFNTRTQLSQLQRITSRRPHPHLDDTSLVLFVSGACRGTGTRAARASYGIYFGPGSIYNTSGLLDPTLPQTIACAEIEALTAALDVLAFITLRYAKFNTVKLVTDSQYLVNAMSSGALEHQKSDYTSTQLRPLAHLDRILTLRKKVEAMSEDGVSCQLWRMTEDGNAEAGGLAIEALDRI